MPPDMWAQDCSETEREVEQYQTPLSPPATSTGGTLDLDLLFGLVELCQTGLNQRPFSRIVCLWKCFLLL